MRRIFTLIYFIASVIIKPQIAFAQIADVVSPAISISDSLALVDLYNSTNGPGWGNNSGWLIGRVKTWHGITLNVSRVFGIELNGNNLSGPIPASLGNLGALNYLYLNNNQLTGNIPATLGKLYNINYLDLSYNNLTGSIPSTLGSDTVLQYLRITNNRLSGTIPSWLSNITNLRYLVLNDNQLTGTIPAKLGNLPHLQWLALYNNQIGGTIPAELGNLPQLAGLWLYNNKLWGAIPAQIGNLVHLQDLVLSNNGLTGTIPPQLGNMTSLQDLELNNNQLYGAIPAQLGQLASLTTLQLTGNQLNGSLPVALSTLSNLKVLLLSHNKFSNGIPTELSMLVKLIDLELNGNKLSGTIPSPIGRLTNLVILKIDSNQLTGTIPASFGNLVKLRLFTLNNNLFNFSGMETVAQKHSMAVYSPQNTILKIHSKSTKLSVSAGGTLTNNTYKWYNNGVLVKTSTGDSTYTPAASGKFIVLATNAVATQLTLYSDTISAGVANHLSTESTDTTVLAQQSGNTIKLSPVPSTSMLVYPNPVHDVLSIRLAGMDGNIAVTITGTDGKRLLSHEINNAPGSNFISLNTSTLAVGIYIVSIQYNGKTLTQKFVKY